MAPPPSIIKLFNTHLIDFIDDIQLILNDPTEMLSTKKNKTVNSCEFIKNHKIMA